MIAPIGRGLGLALALFALDQSCSGFVSSALACACCTNEGQRNVASVALQMCLNLLILQREFRLRLAFATAA